MDTLRLALAHDMPGTPPDQRPARLRAALAAILADGFWSAQFLSLGGSLRRAKDGEPPKWLRAEAQIAAQSSRRNGRADADTPIYHRPIAENIARTKKASESLAAEIARRQSAADGPTDG